MKQKKYLIEEIIWKSLQSDLNIKKHKKICNILNCTEHLFCLPSEISSCVTTSAFASLIDIPIGIIIPNVRLNICEITGTSQ